MSPDIETIMLFVKGLEERAEERHQRDTERWDRHDDLMRSLTANVAMIGTDVAVLKAYREAEAKARKDRNEDEQTAHRRIGTVMLIVSALAGGIAWLVTWLRTTAMAAMVYLGFHR